ncbi:hypothetical protein IV203_002663 [Nitzschia inconspicua]|uniref:Uncharacterized protein n=1 Tax=Nitzschia inconspicua TaxID=303405 RepID=A0A9K3K8S8_9STRA|nr:hypothetical protein IV203_002663 [Nitzschia inconspicua]
MTGSRKHARGKEISHALIAQLEERQTEDLKSTRSALPIPFSLQVRLQNRVETFLEGEIVLYLDDSQLHAVVLHNPVCVASDARRCISHELRWQRGRAVATLCNFGRLARGESILSPKDRFFNPIHAMLAFYIILNGYHSGNRQAAAFYRDFVTSETTNALIYNGLDKSVENGAVAMRLRRKYTGARGRELMARFDDGDKVRRHDSCIMKKARSMTSQHPENSSEEVLGKQLISLFDSYPSRRSCNFKHFVGKHLNSPLKDDLLGVWEANTANPGNRATGPNKAATKLRVNYNDHSVAELLRTHGPQNGKLDGKQFWIKNSQEVVERPADGTPSTKPSISFPDGKFVYDDFCLLGLRERFRDRERQDTCHNTVQATKHPGFRLKTCMEYIDGQNCFAISCKGYTLVYIVTQKSKPVQSDSSIIPLDQHCSKPTRLPNSNFSNDCVVCVAKAEQQYPGMNRREMRRKKLLTKSLFGCPQCKKGKGVSVCRNCWNDFDHELYYMKEK